MGQPRLMPAIDFALGKLLTLHGVRFDASSTGNHLWVPHKRRWDLVDAVSRSPVLSPARIRSGVTLSEVERLLLTTTALPVADRERLINSARELIDVYDRLLFG